MHSTLGKKFQGVLLISLFWACSSPDGGDGGASGSGGVATGTAGAAGSPLSSGGTSTSTGGSSSGGLDARAGTGATSGGGASAGGASSGGASSGGASSGGASNGGASGGMSSAGAATSAGMTGAGAGQGGSGGSGGSGGTGGKRGPCEPPLSYRNLFSEVLMKSDAEVEAKLTAGYQQLFHGKTDNVYYESGGDEAYILDVNNNDVRSEGISYGMMIAVQLDKKQEFDRLWKFAKQHMAMGGGNAGLFNWKTTSSGQVTGNGSAPDGEEYFATALIFASKRWGDGSGIFAYSNEARTVLDAMANKGIFNRSNYLVQFLQNSGYTDPSYILPAFYEVWACFDTKNQAFWKNAVTAARSFFQKTAHPNTGLAPYLANFDGSPYSGGSTFQSDAWRVVGNIMMDHHLFGADPWQTTFAQKFAAFFKSADPRSDEFNLNGTATHTNADGFSKGMVAQNALVAFGIPAADGASFVQALWDMDIPVGQYRYYDGMLYLLSSLHASGRFRLWY